MSGTDRKVWQRRGGSDDGGSLHDATALATQKQLDTIRLLTAECGGGVAMAWHVRQWNSRLAQNTVHETQHPRDDRERHSLFVSSGGDGSFVHLLRPTQGSTEAYSLHYWSDESIEPRISTYVNGTRTQTEAARQPSETLQQLIAQHHQHPDQWPILLDKLQEEYPQLHEAIEAHHAARRSSDAAQYARSFAEVSR